MTEYFEIEKNNKTFCLCEICLKDESGQDEVSAFVEKLISNARAGIENYIAGLIPTDEENEKISRWSIVPFRYRLFIYCRQLCDVLVFIECVSSFDARFPGGRHIMSERGLIFDPKRMRCINPSFALLLHVSKKEQQKLGAPLDFSFDGEHVKLVCTLGEHSLNVDTFCKWYKTFSDLNPNFDKKTIDKQRNI